VLVGKVFHREIYFLVLLQIFCYKPWIPKLKPKRKSLISRLKKNTEGNKKKELVSNKIKTTLSIHAFHTRLDTAGTCSVAPLPPKNPRPMGLYETIPMPSSLDVRSPHTVLYIRTSHCCMI
jgi:hypothetical protein